VDKEHPPRETPRPARVYDLGRTYGEERPIARYVRLTVGEGAGLGALIAHELVLGFLVGLPGLLGLALRRLVYPSVFRGIARSATLGRHVTLRCPRNVRIGDGVIVDDFAQLIATSRKQEAIRIGAGSFLRSFAMLNAGPPDGFIQLGEGCGVGQGAILYGNGGLTIGNKVLIGGQCFIVASSHRTDDPDLPIRDQGYTAEGILIESDVWIGAGAKILDGVTIGRGAVVGANAVVTRSVAPGARVGGVPARPLSDALPSDLVR
jgi:acetyltransferase-like isoleucine patch superfamily enzyme